LQYFAVEFSRTVEIVHGKRKMKQRFQIGAGHAVLLSMRQFRVSCGYLRRAGVVDATQTAASPQRQGAFLCPVQAANGRID
jgi:hypothetical protein